MPEPRVAGGPSGLRSATTEVVTIVLGILIAFGLDAGWGALLEQREEKRLLAALATEIDHNIDLLDVGIRNHARLEASTGLLLDRMMEAAVGDTIVVPDSLLYSLMSAYSVNFSRVEIAGTATSGRIDLIGDAEIRAKVSTLSRLFDDLVENEDASLVQIDRVLLPSLVGKMELSPVYRSNLDWSDAWLGTPRWVSVTEATRALVAAKVQDEHWNVYESEALQEALRVLGESVEAATGRD